MQKTAIEAKQGLTTYQRAFDALNIDLDAFIQLPTERKLEAIGKAMKNANNQQEAYAAAMQILGTRNAPKLNEVLQRLGTDGFDAIAEAAAAAGQVMTEDTAAALDGVADKFVQWGTAAKTAVAGFAVEIANLIPAFNSVHTELAVLEGDIASLKEEIALKQDPSKKNLWDWIQEGFNEIGDPGAALRGVEELEQQLAALYKKQEN